ncbi:MAG: hypothetical protein ACK4GT_14800 [Pararhodobacter sp.]
MADKSPNPGVKTTKEREEGTMPKPSAKPISAENKETRKGDKG